MKDFQKLFQAVQQGNIQAVFSLIKKGACINATDSVLRNTPLHWAVWYHPEMIPELLKIPHIQVNNQNRFGCTPAHWAAKIQPKTLIALLKAPDIHMNIQDISGNTPLHVICQYHPKQISPFLLMPQFDQTVKNNADKTAEQIYYEQTGQNFHDAIQNQLNKLLKSGVHRCIKKLQKDQDLFSELLKQNLIGDLLNSLNYAESMTFYNALLKELPYEMKSPYHEPIRLKRQDSCSACFQKKIKGTNRIKE